MRHPEPARPSNRAQRRLRHAAALLPACSMSACGISPISASARFGGTTACSCRWGSGSRRSSIWAGTHRHARRRRDPDGMPQGGPGRCQRILTAIRFLYPARRAAELTKNSATPDLSRCAKPTMPLPRYASKGAIRFLGRYVRRRFFSHFIVLAAVLTAVLCNVGLPVCGQASGRRPRAPISRRRPCSGARSGFCWGWSPATTCCGASPDGLRPTLSSPSAATCASTCSTICPGRVRAISSSSFPARSPGASRPRRMPPG